MTGTEAPPAPLALGSEDEAVAGRAPSLCPLASQSLAGSDLTGGCSLALPFDEEGPVSILPEPENASGCFRIKIYQEK